MPGGRLSVGLGLEAYIGFAYKLDPAQNRAVAAQIPKWAKEQFYEIDARANGNPSKDQMRLMMQSLLADRFRLAVHFETRNLPVLALVMVAPGKTGPKLRPHAEGRPCPDSYIAPMPGALLKTEKVFPAGCGANASWFKADGTAIMGTRNSTMQMLAEEVESFGFLSGEINQPIVDRTGLQGTFDYTIEWSGRLPVPRPNETAAAAPDPSGITFVQALRQQLGLKLERSRADVRTIIIDRIERPSEN
jgi:uncharacterized protein (TIGR03435 family)